MKKATPQNKYDEPLIALINKAQQLINTDDSKNHLWVADEHPLPSNTLAVLARNNVHFLSNRFDQVEQAKQQGIKSFFSDMDFEALPLQHFDNIFFRIAKERALSHRVINEAFRTLTPNGSLWLSGYKNQGIKTYIDNTKRNFNAQTDIERGNRQRLLAKLQNSGAMVNNSLDDKDYSNLRECHVDGMTFFSKPGLYGWDKVDQGSALLTSWISQLPERIQNKEILDIGCGYGYLSMFCAHMGATKIVATDNCAAAIGACSKNLSMTTVPSTVVADDAGTAIKQKFDVVLCNPPFHQGFTTTPELHSKFLNTISKCLAPEGKLYLVINQFLSLQKEASKFGISLTEQITDQGFTVLEGSLTQPRRSR